MLQEWIEGTDDFPAAFRVRDDNTDRMSGVLFSPRIPPLREAELPAGAERWGREGP